MGVSGSLSSSYNPCSAMEHATYFQKEKKSIENMHIMWFNNVRQRKMILLCIHISLKKFMRHDLLLDSIP